MPGRQSSQARSGHRSRPRSRRSNPAVEVGTRHTQCSAHGRGRAGVLDPRGTAPRTSAGSCRRTLSRSVGSRRGLVQRVARARVGRSPSGLLRPCAQARVATTRWPVWRPARCDQHQPRGSRPYRERSDRSLFVLSRRRLPGTYQCVAGGRVGIDTLSFARVRLALSPSSAAPARGSPAAASRGRGPGRGTRAGRTVTRRGP